MRRPFYWKARKAWYVKQDGSNLYLSDNEQEAKEVWAELVSANDLESKRVVVAALFEEYLRHAQKEVKPETYASVSMYLADFANLHGKKRVHLLKVIDITRWLASHDAWGVASHRAAIGAVKRAINWGVEQDIVERNPIAKMKKPGGRRREIVIHDDTHSLMMNAADENHQAKRRGAFRAVLIALRHSGARPGTIATARIEHVSSDGSTWLIPEHKTVKKTGKPLIVYLSPCLQTLTKILAHNRATGLLFRDSRRNAWTRNAIRCRMKRLREKLHLPAGSVAYAYRHTYITKALMSGSNTATVAELVGHKDATMIARHYGHLEQEKEFLMQAAEQAHKKKA